MADAYVMISINDEEKIEIEEIDIKNAEEDDDTAINIKSDVPLKHTYPKPVRLTTKNGTAYLIIISNFEDKKCLSYDICQEKYFSLGAYPDIKFMNHTVSISSDFSNIYIYDGVIRSFAVIRLDLESDKPSIIKIKKCVPKANGTMEHDRGIITTGKNTKSLYLPLPWDEFHIFGGTQTLKHLKWNTKQKKFTPVSDTNCISFKEYLVASNVLFSTKQANFFLIGDNSTSNIWTLSYPSTDPSLSYPSTDRMDKKWIKYPKTLPFDNKCIYEEFGSFMYKNQFILMFGGLWYNKKLDDIFIFDIKNNVITKSILRCPITGKFYAMYDEKEEMVHLFSRYGKLKHWTLDIDKIIDDDEERDYAQLKQCGTPYLIDVLREYMNDKTRPAIYDGLKPHKDRIVLYFTSYAVNGKVIASMDARTFVNKLSAHLNDKSNNKLRRALGKIYKSIKYHKYKAIKYQHQHKSIKSMMASLEECMDEIKSNKTIINLLINENKSLKKKQESNKIILGELINKNDKLVKEQQNYVNNSDKKAILKLKKKISKLQIVTSNMIVNSIKWYVSDLREKFVLSTQISLTTLDTAQHTKIMNILKENEIEITTDDLDNLHRVIATLGNLQTHSKDGDDDKKDDDTKVNCELIDGTIDFDEPISTKIAQYLFQNNVKGDICAAFELMREIKIKMKMQNIYSKYLYV